MTTDQIIGAVGLVGLPLLFLIAMIIFPTPREQKLRRDAKERKEQKRTQEHLARSRRRKYEAAQQWFRDTAPRIPVGTQPINIRERPVWETIPDPTPRCQR